MKPSTGKVYQLMALNEAEAAASEIRKLMAFHLTARLSPRFRTAEN
jgi:hypothetical protein